MDNIKTQEAAIKVTMGRAFLILLTLNFLLRFFYYGYDFLISDEALWAVTAQMLLDGKRLYAEVWLDRLPGATLVYAVLFYLFGPEMIAVRIFSVLYVFAIALIIYALAAYLYDRRQALLAAFLFSLFSTTYFTLEVIAFNTDLFLALPYAAAALFFLKGMSDNRLSYLFLSGALTGAAIFFKTLGIYNLAFFGLYFSATYFLLTPRRKARDLILAAVFVGCGLASVLGAFLLYLWATSSIGPFYRYCFADQAYYIESVGARAFLRNFFKYGVSYLLFNLPIVSLSLVAILISIKQIMRARGGPPTKDRQSDLWMILWAIASILAVGTTRRFFGHYFIQLLPALSILGARGLDHLMNIYRSGSYRRLARWATASLIVMTAITFIRFHQRTAILAYETLTGRKTSRSYPWAISRDERELREIAAYVSERSASSAYIFVWGFRPEIYHFSRRRPASRYLSFYPLSGFNPGVPLEKAFADRRWAPARQQLLDDLRQTRPAYIIDIGINLPMTGYEELKSFLDENYSLEHTFEFAENRAIIYRRKADFAE